MTTTSTASGKNSLRSTWVVIVFTLAMILYACLALMYYFSLPTDGWIVNEASDQPGKIYLKNVMGGSSDLQPGDRVSAVQGIPVEQTDRLLSLSDGWKVGAVIEYTVIRDQHEMNISVTLMKWQVWKWFLNILFDPLQLADLLSHFILLGLAIFIVIRQLGNPSANSFLLLMMFLMITALGDLSPKGVETWVDPLAQFMTLQIDIAILMFAAPFTLIQFALVFPHPKPIYQRHPWLAFACGSVGLLLLMVDSSEIPWAWFWFVASFFITVSILIHNAYTMRDAVSRAQLRWGLGGVIFYFGLLGLAILGTTTGILRLNPQVFNEFFSIISTIGLTVMGASLAVAILRYRLWEIDLIIRRTLQYSLVTALLALVYLGLVTLLQTIFSAISGQDSPLALVISTLVIAALFNPLRRRVQEMVDRRFYRQKYDAIQSLAQFAAAARAETDFNKMTDALLGVAKETMQPETITLWLLKK